MLDPSFSSIRKIVADPPSRWTLFHNIHLFYSTTHSCKQPSDQATMAASIAPVASASPRSNKLAASTRLRRLLAIPNYLIACPGVYDGFSARIALEIGFDALYMASRILPPARLWIP